MRELLKVPAPTGKMQPAGTQWEPPPSHHAALFTTPFHHMCCASMLERDCDGHCEAQGHMPLERSKQTIEPNSGVWDKDDLGAQCSDGAGQGPNRDSLRGDNDARLSLLVQLRPSDRATAGAMALAAARNGRVTAASAAPTPTGPGAAAPPRSAAPRRRAASTCSASL